MLAPMSKPDPVSAIRNIGPASEALYARAGIHSADELRALGADAAYARLLRVDSHPHFIAYYALVMGLQGRKWNDCKGAEKDALRTRFDAIVRDFRAEQNAGDAIPGIETLLDKIGLPRPR